MKLFDRSRVTSDWKCRRARYYNYEHNGTGIVSGTAAYELFFGTVFHDAAATIANFHLKGEAVPIDTIAQIGWDQLHGNLSDQFDDEEYAVEQAYLMRGMIKGFYRYQWPRLLELYPDIVVVEQEVVGENSFMVKPDLIMRSPEGTLVYIEYKTTSSINDKWLASWQNNPQLHVYMDTIRKTVGLDIGAAIVVGAYKGYVKDGRQSSPFCYAYSRPGQPPFFEPDISYKWKAGYKKLPIWNITNLDPTLWVMGMPEAVLAEQFVMTPPIYLNQRIADTFFRQAAIREAEIRNGLGFLKMVDTPEQKESIMDAWFPQNLEACTPGWGSGCPYASICVDGDDPDGPNWQPRQPHHAPEIEALSKEATDDAD